MAVSDGPYAGVRTKPGTLYEQFHTMAQGTASLHAAADVFTKLAAEYDEHQHALRTAVANIRVSYTGTAADQMGAAFDPLLNSMGQGHVMATASAKSFTGQADYFTEAQRRIAQPVPVPAEPWYEHMVPWDTGYDEAVRANNTIRNESNSAYLAYGKATVGNELPTFAPDTSHFGEISVTGGQPVNPGSPDKSVSGYRSPRDHQATGPQSRSGPAGTESTTGPAVSRGTGEESLGTPSTRISSAPTSGDLPVGRISTGNDTGGGRTGIEFGGWNGNGPGGIRVGGGPSGRTGSERGGRSSSFGTGGSEPGGERAGSRSNGLRTGRELPDGERAGRGVRAGTEGPGGRNGTEGRGVRSGTEGPGGRNGTEGPGGRVEGRTGTLSRTGAEGRTRAESANALGTAQRGTKEEDREHKHAPYLVREENDVVGELPHALPPGGVIGG